MKKTKKEVNIVEKFKYSWGKKIGQIRKEKVAEFYCKGYQSDGVTGCCNYNKFLPEPEIEETKRIRGKHCPTANSHERCIGEIL